MKHVKDMNREERIELVRAGYKLAFATAVKRHGADILLDKFIGIGEDRFVEVIEKTIGLNKGLRSNAIFIGRARDYALDRAFNEAVCDYSLFAVTAYKEIKSKFDVLKTEKRFDVVLDIICSVLSDIRVLYTPKFIDMYPNSSRQLLELTDILEAKREVLMSKTREEEDYTFTTKCATPYSSALSRLHNSAIRRGKILHFAYTSF